MIIAAGTTTPEYCDTPPFHPDNSYPELPFRETSSTANHPYRLIRELMKRLGLDEGRFGQQEWNPLGRIIEPGNTVLLKPNFVKSHNVCGDDIFAIVTHPSILRALIDYAFVALKGEGRIVIADAPTMDCDWDILMKAERIDTIQSFYREKFGFDIELYDLRNFAMIDLNLPAYSSNRRKLSGDPLGSVVINLGKDSLFYGLPSENYYGADYDRTETISHHTGETHEYCVSKTVLSADAVILVPKMKVHKKVGVTLNLKGLVGINTNKNYLVHYRIGTPSEGGDQLPDGRPSSDRMLVKAQRWLFDHALAKQSRLGDLIYRTAFGAYRTLVEPFRAVSTETRIQDAGNWHGNDSCWRMTADLARIAYFANAEGVLTNECQRRMFSVVDGIVAGEKDGPLAASAKRCGCLVMGEDPTAVDVVTARLMGFDVRKIKQLDHVLKSEMLSGALSLKDVDFYLDGAKKKLESMLSPENRDVMFDFEPPPGWKGSIEV